MSTLANRDVRPSAYELLVVDPNAPPELVATSYWSIVGDLQKRREKGEYVDEDLHEVTRAYESISDPVRRAAYNAAIGHVKEPLAKRPLPGARRTLRSRFFRRASAGFGVDHYEVLGIYHDAPATILPAALLIMRDQYLRIPRRKRRLQLLKLLDEAYATLSAPEKRRMYDERTRRGTAGRDGIVGSDLPEAGDGMTPRAATPPPATSHPQGPAPVSAKPAAPAADGHHSSAAGSTAPVLRALVRLPAVAVRSAYRATVWAGRRAGRAWRGGPDSGAKGRGAQEDRQAQRSPVVREPPPRPKGPDVDVEEAMLGRLAASVSETRSGSKGTKPRHRADHDS